VRPHDLDELSGYALGALDADETARVEAHLRECSDCRAELAELRLVTDELDRLPLETYVHAPPEGDRALRRAVRQMREERRAGP
jgi:anti-sigma factor RsiW